jgi:hypothetical protein
MANRATGVVTRTPPGGGVGLQLGIHERGTVERTWLDDGDA